MTKFYQCLHIYPGYARQYEREFEPGNQPNLTFSALNQHLRGHGYYQSYILEPSPESKDTAFFNLWDYRRLQYLWAQENNLPETASLLDIKLAQVEQLQPDVIFDMSPFIDQEFIQILISRYGKSNIRYICWNAYIKDHAMTFPDYHGHTSLHKPFVDYWNANGIPAIELQPGIPSFWVERSTNTERDIDILFYGQYIESIFKNRRHVIQSLLERKAKGQEKINIHLQAESAAAKQSLKNYTDLISPPIFAEQLHSKLSRAKVVVNTYGDFNQLYKSNARLFEAIGHGAILISERGNYPEGFIEGEDYLAYDDEHELNEKLDHVLANWSSYQSMRTKAQTKIASLYSNTSYFLKFKAFATTL
ncbi:MULTISPECIES: glycosyltransferase [Gammaproteobacteria]|uniref:glycosyltransferase family protein n=1 Tax=Gammaproteobacteria TaxID=1236 RepID=UPI000DCF76E8|nr:MULTISPECIES: glycosyltransferase [Gammaproteobacteria]RTE86830.1 glycosyltransferase family 1 protein [Aliidiomarina sp. B3213]TCZ93381.1 glycosyltransferase family 1 protein [Lysobacter sp. N42]